MVGGGRALAHGELGIGPQVSPRNGGILTMSSQDRKPYVFMTYSAFALLNEGETFGSGNRQWLTESDATMQMTRIGAPLENVVA